MQVSTDSFDVVVVGAGIIGLATARALADRLPGASVAVVDKESEVGTHQTGHNSGVLHSGLYYRPGSLKAALCARGRRAMIELCRDHGLPLQLSGKLVVATEEGERAALLELERRGTGNGLSGLRIVAGDELSAIEPHAAGVAALHVPEAGVVDFEAVARHLATDRRVVVLRGRRVESVARLGERIRLATGAGVVSGRVVVNCAGLHSDRVADLAGVEPPVRIVPFRGEYYRVEGDSAHLVRALIYPVPDPSLPFLGVHFTRGIDGTVEVGPNAVLALGREHYRGSPPSLRDLVDSVRSSGLRRLARRHWRTGAAEAMRSLSRRAYAAEAKKLLPELDPADLHKDRAGIRAQAVTPAGDLVDDFVIMESAGWVHVLNAPSPGATASLAIGDHIAQIVAARIGPTNDAAG